MPARSRWVRCSEILVPPPGSGWPWSSARPSRTLASRLFTSSESRSSIRASRAASRAATWRSSAEEAAGLQEAPERVAADGPGGRGRGRPHPGGPPAVVQQGELADQVAGPDDRVDQLAAAADRGDDRHLAGGQHQHVVGRFALAHQEAAHRVVERRRLGGQVVRPRPPVAEDRALAEHLEQRRLVGLGPPSRHLPIPSAWVRWRTRAWAPMAVARSSARPATASASSARPTRRSAGARSTSERSWSRRWPVLQLGQGAFQQRHRRRRVARRRGQPGLGPPQPGPREHVDLLEHRPGAGHGRGPWPGRRRPGRPRPGAARPRRRRCRPAGW